MCSTADLILSHYHGYSLIDVCWANEGKELIPAQVERECLRSRNCKSARTQEKIPNEKYMEIPEVGNGKREISLLILIDCKVSP